MMLGLRTSARRLHAQSLRGFSLFGGSTKTRNQDSDAPAIKWWDLDWDEMVSVHEGAMPQVTRVSLMNGLLKLGTLGAAVMFARTGTTLPEMMFPIGVWYAVSTTLSVLNRTRHYVYNIYAQVGNPSQVLVEKSDGFWGLRKYIVADVSSFALLDPIEPGKSALDFSAKNLKNGVNVQCICYYTGERVPLLMLKNKDIELQELAERLQECSIADEEELGPKKIKTSMLGVNDPNTRGSVNVEPALVGRRGHFRQQSPAETKETEKTEETETEKTETETEETETEKTESSQSTPSQSQPDLDSKQSH
ncbi:MAG: hypothetical protein MHM6MM_006850 [Cercozoa sp. M6MM]